MHELIGGSNEVTLYTEHGCSGGWLRCGSSDGIRQCNEEMENTILLNEPKCTWYEGLADSRENQEALRKPLPSTLDQP